MLLIFNLLLTYATFESFSRRFDIGPEIYYTETEIDRCLSVFAYTICKSILQNDMVKTQGTYSSILLKIIFILLYTSALELLSRNRLRFAKEESTDSRRNNINVLISSSCIITHYDRKIYEIHYSF